MDRNQDRQPLDADMDGVASCSASPAQALASSSTRPTEMTAFIHLHSFVSTTIHLPCLECSITMLQHVLSHVVVASELACKLSSCSRLGPLPSSPSSLSDLSDTNAPHPADAEQLEVHLGEIRSKMQQLRKTVGDRMLESTFWAWLHVLLRSERAWRTALSTEILQLKEGVLSSSTVAVRGRSNSCGIDRTMQHRQRHEADAWTDCEVVERARLVVGLDELVKQTEHRQGDIGALRRVTIFTLDVFRLVSLPPPPVYHAVEPGEPAPPPYTPPFETLSISTPPPSPLSLRSAAKRSTSSRPSSASSDSSTRTPGRLTSRSMPSMAMRSSPSSLTHSLEVLQSADEADAELNHASVEHDDAESDGESDGENKSKRQRRLLNGAWNSPTVTATHGQTTDAQSLWNTPSACLPSSPSSSLQSTSDADGGFSHWLDQPPVTILAIGHALERRCWSLCPSYASTPAPAIPPTPAQHARLLHRAFRPALLSTSGLEQERQTAASVSSAMVDSITS
ncbi:hypothetical protein FA10DRAFT_268174 [Acaromyces ingoldii]|uniref:Uncharacterized protein n=1 Tax=Acaromyces ingoldii TaxID=215250 RepID=A0A316YLG4_9BASI|nr:hypothetical protein FA10DRAFT_268174 [Acaromyces ingoldii]PWN89644.1 hypothetical protein FA10DRAFT_268174 [Acaromyces ingoldii]